MDEKELGIDLTCHTLYSKNCKNEIMKRLRQHYPDRADEMFTKVQLQYAEYLKDWRTDLGGKKNFHNGAGGTYDCIALFSYYTVCREVTSVAELEQMESELFLGAFRKMKFVDVNKPVFKRLMHMAFCKAKSRCDQWNDYVMNVRPFDKNEPIYYEFTACPVAEFAKKHDLLEAMPAMCNPDYYAMELIHARLVRRGNCATDDHCDYTICGDRDDFLKEHEEFVDEMGFRRNK